MSREEITEDFAAGVLRTAINEGRAADLLDCLLAGGSCTVDPVTGLLRLVTAQQLGIDSDDRLRTALWEQAKVERERDLLQAVVASHAQEMIGSIELVAGVYEFPLATGLSMRFGYCPACRMVWPPEGTHGCHVRDET